MNRYGSIRFAHGHARVPTTSFVILLMGNSKLNHLAMHAPIQAGHRRKHAHLIIYKHICGPAAGVTPAQRHRTNLRMIPFYVRDSGDDGYLLQQRTDGPLTVDLQDCCFVRLLQPTTSAVSAFPEDDVRSSRVNGALCA